MPSSRDGSSWRRLLLGTVVQPEGPVLSSSKVSKSQLSLRDSPSPPGVALLEELSLELLELFANTAVPRLGEGRTGASGVTRASAPSWQQPQGDAAGG